MQFVVKHPQDREHGATCGHDPYRGYFAEVTELGVRIVYDSSCPNYEGLEGALFFLADAGYFDADDIWDALDHLRSPRLPPLPPRVRRVLRVVERFETGAVR